MLTVAWLFLNGFVYRENPQKVTTLNADSDLKVNIYFITDEVVLDVRPGRRCVFNSQHTNSGLPRKPVDQLLREFALS